MKNQLREKLASNLTGLDLDIVQEDALTPAAVAIAVTEDETGAPAFILTRRSGRLRRHARQWALPGGRQDPGETLLEAALREMDEEVGLMLGPDTLLGRLDDYPTRSGYCISPFVFWAGPAPNLTPNPDEVHALYRIPLEELNRPESPDMISIPESDQPVIRMAIMDDMVHAPTAAILYQFREVAMHGRMVRVDHYEQPVFAWG
ncbi:MAG: CoA pyrophosphatase [Alphaproteobacteria bacterium]|jgi:8-oxo-dGTP pyrophosphatase MutT (NUDIX family)|nr:CoA pyrophosphatase [Alphaproteobacteria bacterium]